MLLTLGADPTLPDAAHGDTALHSAMRSDECTEDDTTFRDMLGRIRGAAPDFDFMIAANHDGKSIDVS